MTATPETIELAQIAAQAAADKLATQIVAIDVSEHLAITDIFLVVSATNERQVDSVVEGVEEALLKSGHKPTRREGTTEMRWVLLDYLDFVVHVQHTEERELYALERLWKDCPRIELDLDEGPADSAAGDAQSPSDASDAS